MLNCPIAQNRKDRITLAHGGGGKLMNQLLHEVIFKYFGNELLASGADSALLPLDLGAGQLAFTSDSYVVNPLFFAGGNIGDLAVYGTVNDLAMVGARPLFLSCSFILEEGFAIADFTLILQSMSSALANCGIKVVTGDTKVVEKGRADGVYINTSGVGIVPLGVACEPAKIQPGDQIIVSGDIGRHGIAVLEARNLFGFSTANAQGVRLQSDCQPLSSVVAKLLSSLKSVHCMRDLTRGGLSSALIELARQTGLGMTVFENKIAIHPQVRAVSEILGLDPLVIACEGRFILFCSKNEVEAALAILNEALLNSEEAAICIGEVGIENPGAVLLINDFGVAKKMVMFSGEQLPRIC